MEKYFSGENAELKQKYYAMLQQCLKFGKFKKEIKNLIDCLTQENKEKLNQLEEFNYRHTGVGKTNWQTLKFYEHRLLLSVEKNNKMYRLQIFNKDLLSFEGKSENLNINEPQIGGLVVFDIEDSRKNQNARFDLFIVKMEDGYHIMFREWDFTKKQWTSRVSDRRIDENELTELFKESGETI